MIDNSPSTFYIDVIKRGRTHAMTDNTTRLGRPLKPASEGDRVMIGCRVSAEIKNKLDEAARKSGRSQSQELELRLLQSFDRQTQVTVMHQRDENLVSALMEEWKHLATEVKAEIREVVREVTHEELAAQKQRLLVELSKKEDVSEGEKGK